MTSKSSVKTKSSSAASLTTVKTPLGAVKSLPFPGRVVRAGSLDAASVLAIQRRLDAVGCGPIDKDGVFGPQTTAAVQLFQARFADAEGQPLRIDGNVGPITWAA